MRNDWPPRTGDLKAFNTYLKNKRIEAQKRGTIRGFPSYSTARAKLLALLAQGEASGRKVRFAEVFDG